MSTKNKKVYKFIWIGFAIVLLLGTALANVKNLFTSCSVDAEYQIAMAWRLIKGDAMFFEMWEPHQTSAFLLYPFLLLYRNITGGSTGVILYSNIIGLLFKLLTVSVSAYAISKYTDKKISYLFWVFLMNVYPKGVVLPDFANMQVGFGLLLFAFLLLFYRDEQNLLWLVLAAFSLCLQILSYPSIILLFPVVIILIAVYTKKRVRNIIAFALPCIVSGVAYILFVSKGDIPGLIRMISYIFTGDLDHAVGPAEKLLGMLEELKISAPVIGIVLLITALVLVCAFVINRNQEAKTKNTQILFGTINVLMIVLMCVNLGSLWWETQDTKYYFYLIYPLFSIISLWIYPHLGEGERKVFVTGQFVGYFGFLATIILSDMGIVCSLPYASLGMAVLFVPMQRVASMKGIKSEYSICPAIIAFVLVIIFKNGVYVNGWSTIPTNFYEDTVFAIDAKADNGPMKGMYGRGDLFLADISYLEYLFYVEDGSKLMVFSYPLLNSCVYLYRDVEICCDSVISTPSYTDRFIQYWEENPDKMPDVVAVQCYNDYAYPYSFENVSNWVENVFCPSDVVTSYTWKFYYK